MNSANSMTVENFHALFKKKKVFQWQSVKRKYVEMSRDEGVAGKNTEFYIILSNEWMIGPGN